VCVAGGLAVEGELRAHHLHRLHRRGVPPSRERHEADLPVHVRTFTIAQAYSPSVQVRGLFHDGYGA
jgi:hypothetical protein